MRLRVGHGPLVLSNFSRNVRVHSLQFSLCLIVLFFEGDALIVEQWHFDSWLQAQHERTPFLRPSLDHAAGVTAANQRSALPPTLPIPEHPFSLIILVFLGVIAIFCNDVQILQCLASQAIEFLQCIV